MLQHHDTTHVHKGWFNMTCGLVAPKGPGKKPTPQLGWTCGCLLLPVVGVDGVGRVDGVDDEDKDVFSHTLHLSNHPAPFT